jgi:hypothetical protein
MQVGALLLALAPTFSWACAGYNFCRCMNADGKTPNLDATKRACVRVHGGMMTDGFCAASAGNAGIGGIQQIPISNCRMREICNEYGAMGDSWCYGKF